MGNSKDYRGPVLRLALSSKIHPIVFILIEHLRLVGEFRQKIENCQGAANVLDHHLKQVLDLPTNGKIDKSSLITVENSLLKLAAYDGVTDGIIYCFPFIYTIDYKNIMVVR